MEGKSSNCSCGISGSKPYHGDSKISMTYPVDLKIAALGPLAVVEHDILENMSLP